MSRSWFKHFLAWLKQPKTQLLLVTFFIFSLFAWVRLYKLPSTLYFFNDMGRDLLVLWQAWEAKKPFLLGPQNSALPFNQPALYFYSLFPAFLLSGGSFFTHSLTFWLAMTGVLIGLAKWLWKWPNAYVVFISTIMLMIFQPQFVIQNRFIWNPSFVAPFTLVAFFAYWKLRSASNKKPPAWKWILLWAFGLATALAYSYSLAPLVAAWVFLILWQWRWQAWRFALAFAGMSVWWQLPTLVFELRYKFQLTKAVLWGERPPQEAISWVDKLSALQGYFWHVDDWQLTTMASLGLLIIIGGNYWLVWKTNKQKRDQSFVLAGSLLILTLIATIFTPVSVQAHYVFGVFVMLLIMLASLRSQLLIVVSLLVACFWLRPGVLAEYYQPPRWTVDDLQACGELVCSQITQPFFVSTQSRLHPYHNGPEWRFVFARSGCQVKSIETENDQAQTMLVVADKGLYQHGETAFYELSLFGDSQHVETIACPAEIMVERLER